MRPRRRHPINPHLHRPPSQHLLRFKMHIEISLTPPMLNPHIFPPRPLNQYLHRLIQKLPPIRNAMFTRPPTKQIQSLIHHRPAHKILLPSRRRRPRPRRIRKRMHMNKLRPLHHLQRPLKLLIRLPWKPHDNIRRQRRPIERLIHPLHHHQKILPRILPIHPPQKRIRSALQRQMKMRHHLGQTPHDPHQLLIQIPRLQRRQPQPPKIGNPFTNLPEKLGKIRTTIPQLPAPQRRRLPIRAQKYPRQHQFLMPRRHQPPRLLHHIPHRLTPKRRPQLRNDAISAMSIAPILHLQERPLMPLLPVLQHRQRNHPDFLLDDRQRNCFTRPNIRARRKPACSHPSIHERFRRQP